MDKTDYSEKRSKIYFIKDDSGLNIKIIQTVVSTLIKIVFGSTKLVKFVQNQYLWPAIKKVAVLLCRFFLMKILMLWKLVLLGSLVRILLLKILKMKNRTGENVNHIALHLKTLIIYIRFVTLNYTLSFHEIWKSLNLS